MSILNNPQTPQLSHAEAAAEEIKKRARATFQNMVQAFNSGANMFWRNMYATPTEIAAALGTDAQEVFELHGKLGQLIASVQPSAIAPGMAVVGAFDYNPDGSVVIVPPSKSSSSSVNSNTQV